jgi:hypothetical protein
VRKGIKTGIISGVVIIIGVVAYYLASPLFISTKVNEPLPASVVESDAYKKFITMNEEEKLEASKQMSPEERDQIMAIAAKRNNSINETMDVVQQRQQKQQTQNTTITANAFRRGTFVGVGDGIHNAEGIAKVIPIQDRGTILRLENLKATNGPDLHVYLATDTSASDFVNLGRLKANNGNQNYNIPSETDLSKYDTVLIWCRPFSVLFGSADLKFITSSASASNTTSNFLTYDNHPLGIRIQHPSNWSITETSYNPDANNTIVIISSPSKTASELGNISGVSGSFVPYLDIYVFDSKNMSLDKIINGTINKFVNNENFAIHESKPIALKGNQQAYMLMYDATVGGDEFFKKLQVYTIFDSKVYVLTFTSQAASFSNYLPLVQKMVNSFEESQSIKQ